MKNVVRTRFAPSPTGYLHVGGIRTALFAWLVARQHGGQFILRLEDTDKKREVSGSAQHLINSLKALGLNCDEGPDSGGPYGPYRQSERLDIYQRWAQKLIESGRAYADPYTSDEVQKFRELAQSEHKPFLYRNHRPDTPVGGQLKWDGKTPLRFKSEPKNHQWHDVVMGDLATGPEVVDDFILIKSDGYPTYNFAHIVDDTEMRISHVIRGQEYIASVPNYLNLYEALELAPPVMATMPHIMGPTGNKKLSKRDGAKDIHDYMREGFLPEALISFIATLGWNDGTEQEIFTREELINKFSLECVQRSGAKFDEQRLLWMNGHYLRRLEPEELLQAAGDFWPESARGYDKEYKLKVLGLVQERLKYLAELPDLTEFFFTDPVKYPDLDKEQSVKLLPKVIKTLQDSVFSEEDLEERLRTLAKTLGQKPGDLFKLVRVSVTGRTVAPGLFETLHVLDKDTTLRRLGNALQHSNRTP